MCLFKRNLCLRKLKRKLIKCQSPNKTRQSEGSIVLQVILESKFALIFKPDIPTSLLNCIGFFLLSSCSSTSVYIQSTVASLIRLTVFNFGHRICLSFEMQLWTHASFISCNLILCFTFSDNGWILYWRPKLLLPQLLFHYMALACVQ